MKKLAKLKYLKQQVLLKVYKKVVGKTLSKVQNIFQRTLTISSIHRVEFVVLKNCLNQSLFHCHKTETWLSRNKTRFLEINLKSTFNTNSEITNINTLYMKTKQHHKYSLGNGLDQRYDPIFAFQHPSLKHSPIKKTFVNIIPK